MGCLTVHDLPASCVPSLCTSQPQYQVFQCERNISFPAVGFTEEYRDRGKRFMRPLNACVFNINLTSLVSGLLFVWFCFGQTCKAFSLTPKRLTEWVLMLLKADIKTQLCVAGPKTLKRQKGLTQTNPDQNQKYTIMIACLYWSSTNMSGKSNHQT